MFGIQELLLRKKSDCETLLQETWSYQLASPSKYYDPNFGSSLKLSSAAPSDPRPPGLTARSGTPRDHERRPLKELPRSRWALNASCIKGWNPVNVRKQLKKRMETGNIRDSFEWGQMSFENWEVTVSLEDRLHWKWLHVFLYPSTRRGCSNSQIWSPLQGCSTIALGWPNGQSTEQLIWGLHI